MEMADLPSNVLVRIAELCDTWDLKNLRLVSKEWHDAVGCAQICLQPTKGITGPQLSKLCSLFPRASQLSLYRSENLADTSLEVLQAFPHLAHVFFWYCNWLTPAGIAHLAPLTGLKTLVLASCESLTSLPDNVSALTSLYSLKIAGCGALSSLPESISALTGLGDLDVSSPLTSLPEGIQFLTALEHLSVQSFPLRSIPAGIGCLFSLKR